MPDSTSSDIDRVFDFVEGFVDKANHVFERVQPTKDQPRAQLDARRPAQRAKSAAPSSSTSVVLHRRPRFRIDEVIAAETGQPIFVVTDGGNARAECSTRALAEKILSALEASP